MYCFFCVTSYDENINYCTVDLYPNINYKIVIVDIQQDNLILKIYFSFLKRDLEYILTELTNLDTNIKVINRIEKMDWLPRIENKITAIELKNDTLENNLYSDILVFIIKKLGYYNTIINKFLPTTINNYVTENKIIPTELELVYKSIVVVDIENYTTTTNNMSNSQITRYLTEFYSLCHSLLSKYYFNSAKIYQFIGDSVIIVFEDPNNAVEYSRDLLNTSTYNLRVGISTGFLYKGNINYGDVNCNLNINNTDIKGVWVYIGKTINLASRLEQLNKFYNTRLLFDEATALLLDPSYAANVIDTDIHIKGFNIDRYNIYTLKNKLHESIINT